MAGQGIILDKSGVTHLVNPSVVTFPLSLSSFTLSKSPETTNPAIMSLPTEPKSWRRKGFVVSTNKELLSISAINHAFDQSFMYWAQPIPEDTLQKIIDNSFCFGLYEIANDANPANGEGSPSLKREDLKQIGFGRLITDNITFAYFTDLYVLPEYQGLGLGGWIIDCIDEMLKDLPYLRWTLLRTSSEKSQRSYEQKLGMEVLKCGDANEGPIVMGRRGNGGRA